jgi:hypothetical protein
VHAEKNYTDVPLDENPLYLAALILASLGLRVFPCRPWDKRPQFKGFKQRATRSEAMLTVWWTRFPNANPAFLTGELLDGVRLVIADLDTPEAAQYAEEQGWPASTSTTTRRGRHLWYRWSNPTPPVSRESKGRRISGVDLKGEGPYALGPCSRVRSTSNPDEVTVYKGRGIRHVAQLLEVPAEIERAMLPDPPRVSPSAAAARPRVERSGKLADWLAEVRVGYRAAAIFSILLQAQGLGRDKAEVFAEIKASPVSVRLAEELDPDGFLERQWSRAEAKYKRPLVTKKRGITTRQEAALRRVERRAQKAWKAGVLSDNEYEVLDAHFDTAREFGVDYYLALTTVAARIDLTEAGIHQIQVRLRKKGWLEDLGSPHQAQAHYWAILDQGTRIITKKHSYAGG